MRALRFARARASPRTVLSLDKRLDARAHGRHFRLVLRTRCRQRVGAVLSHACHLALARGHLLLHLCQQLLDARAVVLHRRCVRLGRLGSAVALDDQVILEALGVCAR